MTGTATRKSQGANATPRAVGELGIALLCQFLAARSIVEAAIRPPRRDSTFGSRGTQKKRQGAKRRRGNREFGSRKPGVRISCSRHEPSGFQKPWRPVASWRFARYTQARLGGSDDRQPRDQIGAKGLAFGPPRPSGRAERQVNRGDLWG